jgi:hypothetical protein
MEHREPWRAFLRGAQKSCLLSETTNLREHRPNA